MNESQQWRHFPSFLFSLVLYYSNFLSSSIFIFQTEARLKLFCSLSEAQPPYNHNSSAAERKQKKIFPFLYLCLCVHPRCQTSPLSFNNSTENREKGTTTSLGLISSSSAMPIHAWREKERKKIQYHSSFIIHLIPCSTNLDWTQTQADCPE